MDERSLPEGSYLTTDKVVVVNVTEGLLVKVNFGVNLDYERFKSEDRSFFIEKVNISQETDRPEPRMNVSLFTEEIVVYDDHFVENAEFRIFNNYAPFVDYWKLEIVDEDTDKPIRAFTGNQLDIHDPVFWDGKDNKGEHIRLDRDYVYRVYVENEQGRFDETKAEPITFRVIEEEEALKEYQEAAEERRENYRRWLITESKENTLYVQTIPVDGETVVIDPMQTKIKSIHIMKDGQLISEIPLVEKRGLTARELLEGEFVQEEPEPGRLEVIIPKGKYEVLVQEDLSSKEVVIEEGVVEGEVVSIEELSKATGVPAIAKAVVISEQDIKPVKTYAKEIKVGEDYMFFVAMGDAQMGYTFNTGNIEPVQHDDQFNGGFWTEGKMAYYLQGKVLGKYLITSSFDSEREKKELFRNIDEDLYYPVYGDSSTVDYDATDTQGPLYLLVEWDKSSAIWGNYSIGFDETEFSQYKRDLYGSKVDFETLSTTKFGEARSKVVVFRARTQQKPSHNEFLATGGSLYYMKHKDIIEGSDSVVVEIRDKITGLVLGEQEMKEGADYEMDYDSGRIIFWKPVPMLVESSTIISNDLLDGNPVYVVVDYEYETKDKVDEGNMGTRVRQAFSDHVLVGGTYVRDEQEDSNYYLRGADVTVHLGDDATVVAEYAETESEAMSNYISTDGGLSFTELATSDGAKGRAYGLKGDAKLFHKLGLISYYKWIDNDFSTPETTSQQGKELAGFEVTYDFNEESRFTMKHDVQRLISSGNAQTQLQLGAHQTVTTLAQLVYEARKLKLTGEYRRQEVKERLDQFTDETNVEEHTLAARADYELTDKVAVSLEQQVTLHGEPNHQTSVGVTVKPTDKLSVSATETVGTDGMATSLEVTADMSEKISVTGGYTIQTDADGETTNDSSYAATGQVDLDIDLTEKTKLKTSVGMEEDSEGERTRTISVGGSTELIEGTRLESGIAVSESPKDQSTTMTFGGTSQVGEDTHLESKIEMTESTEGETTTMTFGGTSRVDDATETESQLSITESAIDGKTTAVTFGTKKRINDELELATTRTFGTSKDSESVEDGYTLTRSSGGKKLEGSLSRQLSEGEEEISRTNIFGLSGDIDDRWAFSGTFERGDVQHHDGSESLRHALSMGLGYAKEDPETGESFTSSTKVEVIVDDGEEDTRQYLFTNATEGKLTPSLTLFGKLEFSKTRNLTSEFTEAEHKEMSLGGAYRPIELDRLNLLGRYTYLEEKAPEEQEDTADIEEEKAHVFSAEAIYDIDEKWQVSEKFAYRILEEKVTGFEFTKTHTWLMIHRLNYNIDRYWSIGGEFRMLTQQEAKDSKRGFLLEVARRMGEYAQLGMGYNFTDFSDDLTDLDYTAQGPFVRLTGKFYDRTTDEVDRARQRWLEEKIYRWAWIMVQQELAKDNSPILEELNHYYFLAQKAEQDGQLEESQKIYKDIIVAGQMMLEEAAVYIRSQIHKEEKLKGMSHLADEYFKNGQYEKAKKILEKILEEVQ